MVMTSVENRPRRFSGQTVAYGEGVANTYTENKFTDTIGNGTIDSTPIPIPPACQVNDQIFSGIFPRRHTPHSEEGKVDMKVVNNVYSPNL
jgi:hypothetical protein